MSFRIYEKFFRGAKLRILQGLARSLPGSGSIRVWLHRLRGVHIGKNVFIGLDVLIDTSRPEKVYIGNDVTIGMRATLIGHFGMKGDEHMYKKNYSMRIEDKVFIGPGVIILPEVIIGEGAVISAGSVITRSVPSYTMVQGNPAKPVAKCGIALTQDINMWDFYKKLKPIRDKKATSKKTE